MVTSHFVSSMVDKGRHDIGVTVQNIDGTRIRAGFRDSDSVALFFDNKVLDQMCVIKGRHKERISLSNTIAVFHSFLHGVHVFGDPIRHLFFVRPCMCLDSVRRLLDRALNELAVVDEILNRIMVRVVARTAFSLLLLLLLPLTSTIGRRRLIHRAGYIIGGNT